MTDTVNDMTNGHSNIAAPKTVLSISLAKYLHGHDVADVIAEDWNAKATSDEQARFDNHGFNLDPIDVGGTLASLKHRLQEREWDGVIVGWCTRGNIKFTPLFEKVVREVVGEVVRREEHGTPGDKGLKMMFSDGADDLFRTTMRTFG